MPIYNDWNSLAALLPEIDQILHDNQLNAEIIIVDDNSTDNTYDVLKPYFDRICYIRNKDKGGIVRARLCGIHQSSGAYIGLLDADVLMIWNQTSFGKRWNGVGLEREKELRMETHGENHLIGK